MLELILALVIAVLVGILFLFYKKMRSLQFELAESKFNKASQSVKYGQLTEQWLPFLDKFPYDSQQFNFIGKPIDGLVFADDKIVFCEFKTNKSKLNEKQKWIKDLVERKKVEWLEFNIK
jgi:predicted Holliday junction resolvase-like endonuclease